MKTVKICYPVHPWYCPNCKTLYFSEVECECCGSGFDYGDEVDIDKCRKLKRPKTI